jgi:glycosyltransferase involved in cell wall biosynthesis
VTGPAAGDLALTTTPRLTVLIPCWNAAGSIERSIGSVLDEREVPLECVVIDDGSTDGTADVVAAIAAHDPRVIVMCLPENGGVSSARNEGLALARGEWLAFLDADDRLLPGGVAALMRPTADPAVRAVIGQRIWTDGERTWLSPVYDIPDIREPGRKSIATHPGLLYYASATGKVIHRSLWTGLNFEGRVLGDQPWTIRSLLRAGDGIEVIGETVYEWTRPHPDRPAETIGTATRASARRAALMANVARTAFAEVAAEIDATIPDDATRHAIRTAYLDRLIRSDLGSSLRDALERRDPDIGVLFLAIGRFLASVPTSVLAESIYLTSRLLTPPAVVWRSLRPDARQAYWSMAMPAMQADRGLARRVPGRWRMAAFILTHVIRGMVGRAVRSARSWIGAAVSGVLRRTRPR